MFKPYQRIVPQPNAFLKNSHNGFRSLFSHFLKPVFALPHQISKMGHQINHTMESGAHLPFVGTLFRTAMNNPLYQEASSVIQTVDKVDAFINQAKRQKSNS